MHSCVEIFKDRGSDTVGCRAALASLLVGIHREEQIGENRNTYSTAVSDVVVVAADGDGVALSQTQLADGSFIVIVGRAAEDVTGGA